MARAPFQDKHSAGRMVRESLGGAQGYVFAIVRKVWQRFDQDQQ